MFVCVYGFVWEKEGRGHYLFTLYMFRSTVFHFSGVFGMNIETLLDFSTYNLTVASSICVAFKW